MSVSAELATKWQRAIDEGRSLWWGPQAATLHVWRAGRWYWIEGDALRPGKLIDVADGAKLHALFDAHGLDALVMKEGPRDAARARDPFVDPGVVLEVVIGGFWTETLTFALEKDGSVSVGSDSICNDGSGMGSAREATQVPNAAAAVALAREKIAARGVPDVKTRRAR